MRSPGLAAVAIAIAAAGCAADEHLGLDAGAADAAAVEPDAAAAPTWPFPLPEGFPVPRLPEGATLTAELAELGRHLFFDERLSGNGTQACGSCHLQERGFSDGRTTGVGSTGEVLRRNSMALVNVAYNPAQTWANPLLATLEQQAMVPIFAEHPVELGVTGHEEEILDRLRAEPVYDDLFAAAYPGEAEPYSFPRVVAAIAAYQRRLISGDSRVDRYRRGDLGALTASEIGGFELFFSEELECHHCHGGFNFTIAVDHAGLAEPAVHYFNNGLYDVGGTGDYPATDQGLHEFTLDPADRGRYRPPSLRNVAVSAPYMHDGSVATLEEVVAIYERGGRLVPDGPLAGDGAANPNKSSFVNGFNLTDTERADLLAFLRALSDDAFLTDPALGDPWPTSAPGTAR